MSEQIIPPAFVISQELYEAKLDLRLTATELMLGQVVGIHVLESNVLDIDPIHVFVVPTRLSVLVNDIVDIELDCYLEAAPFKGVIRLNPNALFDPEAIGFEGYFVGTGLDGMNGELKTLIELAVPLAA